MGLDGLGSAAYGPEAMLTVLAVVGSAGLGAVQPITWAILVQRSHVLMPPSNSADEGGGVAFQAENSYSLSMPTHRCRVTQDPASWQAGYDSCWPTHRALAAETA